GRDQEALAGERAELVVGNHHVLRMGPDLFDERGRDGLPSYLQWPGLMRCRGPLRRWRGRRLARGPAPRQGEEAADCFRRLVARETKLPFDLQAQFHAVQTIQAELVQAHLGALFGFRYRPMEPVAEQMQDGGPCYRAHWPEVGLGQGLGLQ